MLFSRFPFLLELGTGASGRWRLWALFAAVAFVACIGTWGSGQYKIGRLDLLKGRYENPVQNFAGSLAKVDKNSLEFDLLEGCKQSQIGTWLQTTDALQFRGPLTGNRIEVSLDENKSFLDLNGKEISSCVQGDIEDLQFNIGSMVNSWAVILLLVSFCLGAWSWVCFAAQQMSERKGRNIYAETLESETFEAKSEEGAEPEPEQPSPDSR